MVDVGCFKDGDEFFDFEFETGGDIEDELDVSFLRRCDESVDSGESSGSFSFLAQSRCVDFLGFWEGFFVIDEFCLVLGHAESGLPVKVDSA